jgi:hypothetical protein
MTSLDIALPHPRASAFTIVLRNALVWRKLLGPSLALSFGR